MERKPRDYYGVTIYPVTRWTAIGARWEANVPGRGFVIADTLEGIKAVIRLAVTHDA